MQEVLGKKIITDDEAVDLHWISQNSDLFEFIRKNTSLLNFIQSNTSESIREFIKKINELTEGKEEKIKYYEYLLEFVDNMIKSVEKRSTSSLKQSVQTTTAMDALYALRKEYVDSRITSLLEQLKSLAENVERTKRELESKEKELETKQKEIELTEKEFNTLQSQLRELRNLRGTLLEEKASLDRQVKAKLEQISTEFAEEKAIRKQEMSRELQEELKALTTKRDELYLKINSMIKEHETEENVMQMALGSYEVEWVPIKEDHEIYKLSHWSFETYINQLIEIYCLRTNKSKEVALSDFAKNSPALLELNEMFKNQFTNESINDTLHIRKILNCRTWNSESKGVVKELLKLLSKIKVPHYIEKKNYIRNVDALNVYLQSLSLKVELAKALAERDALRHELENLLIAEPERAIQKTK